MKRTLKTAALFAAVATALFTITPVLADEQDVVDVPDSVNLAANVEEVVIAEAPTTGAVQVDHHWNGPKFDLSDDQLEKLRALRDKYSVDNATKRAQIMVLRHQLMDDLSKNGDKSTALATQAKINALTGELANARVSMMADASTVFTAEQRQAMHHRMLRHELGGGFGGGPGHHRGGHHGFGGGRGGDCGPGKQCGPTGK